MPIGKNNGGVHVVIEGQGGAVQARKVGFKRFFRRGKTATTKKKRKRAGRARLGAQEG
jgi:hypothetical protein